MIRPARPDEAPAAAAIAERAYALYIERIGRRPTAMDDDYAGIVRAGRLFIAEREGAVAGYVVLVPHEDHLLVENVAVDPSQQRQGIGRELLAFAEAEAHRRGLGLLRLYTNAAMVENIELYGRLGWRETGRRTERGYARVHFEKRLD